MRRIARCAFVGLIALGAGCSASSGPGVIEPSRYDPAALVNAAFQEFDKNGDGTLEGAELENCPALKSCLPFVDRNHDKKISREELQQRFEQYAAAGTLSVVAVSCQISLDGRPLQGAKVTFSPEKFMGPACETASGTTDAEGMVTPQIEGETRVGIPAGLYRISISKTGQSGKEELPARYNSRTVLGREVFDDGRSGGGLFVFELTSS